MKGYPTVDELKEIRDRNIFSSSDALELLQYIEKLWHAGNIITTGKKVIYIQMQTCGHPGNEAIIAALKDNRWFWTYYWQASNCNGHHWFKIDTRKAK